MSTELEKLRAFGLEALSLGMSIRQDQFQGVGSQESGRVQYNKWFDEKFKSSDLIVVAPPKKLSLEQKVDYMRIGLSFIGVPVDSTTSEYIVRLYEGIAQKGQGFSIDDAIKIETVVKQKISKRIISAVPEGTSE